MGARLHIRRNDMVVVRSGSAAAADKPAKVLHVLVKSRKALVEGMNFVSKTVRKSQERPQGDIIRKEAPLPVAKLMLYCAHCKKGVRTQRVTNADGVRVRKCRKCAHLFD